KLILVSWRIYDHAPWIDKYPADGSNKKHSGIEVETHPPTGMAGCSGQRRQPGDHRNAYDLTEVAYGIHETGDRTRVTLADIDGGGPARRHPQIFYEGRKTNCGVRQADVSGRAGHAREHKRAAESVSYYALQSSAPAPTPQANLAVGEKPSQQACQATKE